MKIENIKSRILEFAIAGKSEVEITKMNITNLLCNLAGKTSFKLNGYNDTLNINCIGSHQFDALNLENSSTTINGSGKGYFNLWIKDELNVHTIGSYSINHKGEPTKKNISKIGKCTLNHIN